MGMSAGVDEWNMRRILCPFFGALVAWLVR